MKKKLKKWALRLTVTGLVVTGLLILAVLKPGWAYGNRTPHNGYAIYHSGALDAAFKARLDAADRLVRASELYDPAVKLDICLNDGSVYPRLIGTLLGPAFARGFSDKVVLQGEVHADADFMEVNGYRWNLTQLLAHEMVHCLHYQRLGFWGSNPAAGIPEWKTEGYAEYISRRDSSPGDLAAKIDRLRAADPANWEVMLADSTMVPRDYYVHGLMVQYCMDIAGIRYAEVLQDSVQELPVRRAMLQWYLAQQPAYVYKVREPLTKSETPPPLMLLLHGYGADVNDLFSFADQMPEDFLVVSLQAPMDLGGGQYAWYPLRFEGGRAIADEARAGESIAYIHGFLSYLEGQRSIDKQRIYLMGFSQGTIMSYGLALLHPGEIRGVAGFSGRMLQSIRPQIQADARHKDLRVFVTHGTQDQVISLATGEEAVTYLRSLGVAPLFKTYRAGHTILPEMMRDMLIWLKDER